MKPVVIVLLMAACMFSCKRIKEKARKGKDLAQENADKLKRRALEKTSWAIDKVIPQFDEHTPDTRHNKERFKEFFGFYPTPDVKNLYCYGDMLGIDAKFQFAFNCDTTTVNRIIRDKGLVIQEDSLKNRTSVIYDKFDWWEAGKYDSITPYWYHVEDRYYIYLWYDSIARKAGYLDFDM